MTVIKPTILAKRKQYDIVQATLSTAGKNGHAISEKKHETMNRKNSQGPVDHTVMGREQIRDYRKNKTHDL